MPTILRSEDEEFELDAVLMSNSWLGQQPVTIKEESFSKAASLCVPEPFGRFGNNFYQIANAAIVATRLGIAELQLPSFQLSPPCRTMQIGDLLLTGPQDEQNLRSTLIGHFYAPFGLESLFTSSTTAAMTKVVRAVSRRYYQDLIDQASTLDPKLLVMHFRGGDIFESTIQAHPWYVQPPAAFYIYAMEHALRANRFDEIRLVVEDFSNPAISVVRRHLDREGIAHAVEQRSLRDDIVSMLSASCVIASASTLPEACCIMSDRLTSAYAFRSFNSQHDFRPFFQSRVEGAIQCNDAQTLIVDDASCNYTPQKSWSNSAAQRAMIADFPIEHLRIYLSS